MHSIRSVMWSRKKASWEGEDAFMYMIRIAFVYEDALGHPESRAEECIINILFDPRCFRIL